MSEVFFTPRTITTRRDESNRSSHSRSDFQSSRTKLTVLHQVTDGADGTLYADFGTVNYALKSVNIRLAEQTATASNYKSDHESAASFAENNGPTPSGSSTDKGGEYGTTGVSEELVAGTTVSASYVTGSPTPTAHTMSFIPPVVQIDLCPYTTDQVTPNSVQFTWMGTVYRDYNGYIFRDFTDTERGILSGHMNYSSGIALMHDYVVGGDPEDFTLDSLFTQKLAWNTSKVVGRTQAAPLKPSGFVMAVTDVDGTEFLGTAGLDGSITGTGVLGTIDYETGVYEIQLGAFVLDSALTAEEKAEWWYDADEVGAVEALKIWRPRVVDPRFLTYNAVAYFYLPLNAELLGIDPVRLPQDGRVPIYREGGYLVFLHAKTTDPLTVADDDVIDLGRTRISRVRVIDADGETINTGYTADLEAGEVTFTDVSGYEQPITIEDQIEDMAVCTDVQVTGRLQFNTELTHEYPVPGSYVASALMGGDRQARVTGLFDQANWDGVSFPGHQVGLAASGTYNDSLSPILVTNRGAIDQKWVAKFTSGSAVQIIGEFVGQIFAGPINAPIAPINPSTGAPYFTLNEEGWGGLWVPGNIVGWETVGASMPIHVIQTVQPGTATGADHRFMLQQRGDVNAPP